ncbi:alpha/beta fold hydrolase [Paenibacillus filicis]|uniref:Alpha/beta fold hydrolase n=1 Tax=Paenibacillus gyeongsangnamensis TaxID=3388067 RepID=A0ABT4QFY6_9BACL|nr:alpha/beta fold hydrolase [Paenibacillus filicis]MCZ8515802.1 alpha/beta fold hydrolase [Paenibacillus filicis]
MDQINDKLKLHYFLSLPNNIENNRDYPLIVFLHGVNQRGNDTKLLKSSGFPRSLHNITETPFIIFSPQCPAGLFWNMITDAIKALLDEIISKNPVDPKRVYLIGASMGGYGAWDLAIKFPERFAAVVPICGGWAPEQAYILKNVPVWAFHGAEDDIVPLKETLNMVEALKKHGGKVELTVYPDAGHDIGTITYNNPLLYEWLLRHKIM